MIPKDCLLLLSGIPATGKSSFGQYLSYKYSFAHYDLECYPRGWPHPEFKRLWDTCLETFIEQLKQQHQRIVLDWGFPVDCINIVQELQARGIELIWFDGDQDRAREAYQRRGRHDLAPFEKQLTDLQTSGYPDSLNCIVVPALSADGTFMPPDQVERMVFDS